MRMQHVPRVPLDAYWFDPRRLDRHWKPKELGITAAGMKEKDSTTVIHPDQPSNAILKANRGYATRRLPAQH